MLVWVAEWQVQYEGSALVSVASSAKAAMRAVDESAYGTSLRGAWQEEADTSPWPGVPQGATTWTREGASGDSAAVVYQVWMDTLE